MKTQYEDTNSKGDIVLKTSIFKDLWYVKINMSQTYIIFHYYYMAWLTKIMYFLGLRHKCGYPVE